MIYPLNQQIETILDNAIDAGTGEMLVSEDDLQRMLLETTESFDDSIDQILCGVKNLRADAREIDEEIAALTNRRDRLVKAADKRASFAAYLLNGEKWHNARHEVKFRKSVRVVLEDSFIEWAKAFAPDLLSYKPAPEPTADKKKINQALAAGKEIMYAHLVQTNNIQIK